MTPRFTCTLLAALALGASSVFSPLQAKPQCPAQIPPLTLAGTIYGTFDPANPGGPAWVGHLLVTIGDEPAQVATIVDRNTGMVPNANGTITGSETISVTFTDGSGSFDIVGEFVVTPAASPALAYLNETGKIANGTGVYAHASGWVFLHGPFLLPFTPPVQGPPQWIAELHGEICLKKR